MSAQPLEARLAHVEGAFLQMDRRLESIERMMDSRFGQVDARFSQVDARFNQIEGRFSILDQRFNWLISILVTSWISTIVTILFHH